MITHFRAFYTLLGWTLCLLSSSLSAQDRVSQLTENGLTERLHRQEQLQQQVRTVSLRLRNVSLERALQSIAQQMDVGIFYNASQLPTHRIMVSLQRATLTEALETVLKDTDLQAVVQDGDIIIKKRIEVKPGVPTVGADDRWVMGQVYSAQTGESLPGVTIVLKGTTLGTTTDSSGTFRISVPQKGAVLVFSFVGMQTQEVVVTTQAQLTIRLATTAQALGEVVVIGYGTQSQANITGAVKVVSEKEIKQTTLTSIDQILQGRTAGVQVTQTSGQPGGSVTVRIRGWSSISAGNEPLYVIDGVPFYNWGTSYNNGPPGIYGTGVIHNAMSAINPNDIESITVLKDAAAANIYGSRAANGVILITTKRGKAGKARISLENYYGIQEVAKRYAVLNARQYAELINESRANARADLGNPATPPVETRPIAELQDPAALGEGTDWQAQIFRQVPIQNSQLTISGGNESTRYAVSGGYFNQDGIIKVSGYKRYSFRLNIDQNVSSRFSIGSSISVNNATNRINRAWGEQRDGGLIFSALLQTPTIPVYDADGNYARPNYASGFALIDNPLASAMDYYHTINTTRLIGNVFGELTLADNLRFRTSIGLDANYLKNNIYIPTYTGTPPPSSGSGFAFASQELVWLNENTLSYNRRFDRHQLDGVAGFTLQGSAFERMISRVVNFPNDLVITTNGGQTDLTNSFREDWRMMSFLGRVNYVYNNRYLLTVAARTDGSSRFGPARRFGFFPSVSAGWRITGEPFMQNLPSVNELKLRVSYGLTGNNEILNVVNSFANYPYIGSITSANYAFGGKAVNGLAPGSLSNAELGWESTAQTDVGIDVGLFKNRLRLSLDWYNKKTTNLLVSNTPLPYTTGFSSSIQNVGSMQNRGWEVSLITINIDRKLNWTTSFNLSHNQNRVLSLGRNVKEIQLGNSIIRPNDAVSSFYGHVVEGIFQNEEEIRAAPKQDAKPGDIRFKDLNGDRVIDNADRTIIGNPLPDFTFGMTNTFAYKGLELSVFLQGITGNEIVNFTRSRAESMGGQHNQTTNTLNRWRSADQPGNGKVPRAVAIDRNLNNRFSTRWVEDGSYLRLRSLTLAYNLPTLWLGKVNLSGAKLYLMGQNLLTLTNYTGYDPEIGNAGNTPLQQGYDSSNYPVARSYVLGLNLQF